MPATRLEDPHTKRTGADGRLDSAAAQTRLGAGDFGAKCLWIV